MPGSNCNNHQNTPLRHTIFLLIIKYYTIATIIGYEAADLTMTTLPKDQIKNQTPKMLISRFKFIFYDYCCIFEGMIK